MKAIDLGLSVKWATCNVGATLPEEYGNYYAWGETEPKENYFGSNYKFCNYTKYKTNSHPWLPYNVDSFDNKTQLERADDAASANWGGKWRMPTDAEWAELIENCAWTWTTRNGVNGYEVKSKINGNSIFLPAAGNKSECICGFEGQNGYYLSNMLSDLVLDNCSKYAKGVFFTSEYYELVLKFNRFNGCSVRPVCE